MLIVTHRGIIKELKEILRLQNCHIHDSAANELMDPWMFKTPNGSITEVILQASGSGAFVRAGNVDHLI